LEHEESFQNDFNHKFSTNYYMLAPRKLLDKNLAQLVVISFPLTSELSQNVLQSQMKASGVLVVLFFDSDTSDSELFKFFSSFGFLHKYTGIATSSFGMTQFGSNIHNNVFHCYVFAKNDAAKNHVTFNTRKDCLFNSLGFKILAPLATETTIVNEVPNCKKFALPIAFWKNLFATFANEGDLILDCCPAIGSAWAAAISMGFPYMFVQTNPDLRDVQHHNCAISMVLHHCSPQDIKIWQSTQEKVKFVVKQKACAPKDDEDDENGKQERGQDANPAKRHKEANV